MEVSRFDALGVFRYALPFSANFEYIIGPGSSGGYRCSQTGTLCADNVMVTGFCCKAVHRYTMSKQSDGSKPHRHETLRHISVRDVGHCIARSVQQGQLYSSGLATFIFGVLESVRTRPSPTLYRIHFCRVKMPIQTVQYRKEISCRAARNPPESAQIRPSTESVRIPNRHPRSLYKARFTSAVS